MDETVYVNTTKIYNKLGRRYLADIESLVPPEREEFIKLLKPGAKVLDVGCAGGRDTEAFIKARFAVDGIDLSEVFLRQAKNRVPEAIFQIMDARKLTFANESFDAIWANAVLLHILKSDIPKTLAGFNRILRKNGILHVRIKKGEGSSLITDSLSQETQRYFSFFTEDEIQNFLYDAQFHIKLKTLVTDEAKRPGVTWISIFAVKESE